MKKLSEILSEILKTQGLSAADVARMSGVSNARISEIVNNKTQNPRWDTIVKIADALKIPLSDFGGEKTIVADPQPQYASGLLRPEEQDLVSTFRQLDDRQRANIVEIMAGYEALSEIKKRKG